MWSEEAVFFQEEIMCLNSDTPPGTNKSSQCPSTAQENEKKLGGANEVRMECASTGSTS